MGERPAVWKAFKEPARAWRHGRRSMHRRPWSSKPGGKALAANQTSWLVLTQPAELHQAVGGLVAEADVPHLGRPARKGGGHALRVVLPRPKGCAFLSTEPLIVPAALTRPEGDTGRPRNIRTGDATDSRRSRSQRGGRERLLTFPASTARPSAASCSSKLQAV